MLSQNVVTSITRCTSIGVAHTAFIRCEQLISRVQWNLPLGRVCGLWRLEGDFLSGEVLSRRERVTLNHIFTDFHTITVSLHIKVSLTYSQETCYTVFMMYDSSWIVYVCWKHQIYQLMLTHAYSTVVNCCYQIYEFLTFLQHIFIWKTLTECLWCIMFFICSFLTLK